MRGSGRRTTVVRAGDRVLWERFLAIKQEGTVSEYRSSFEVLSTPLLPGISEELLESVFMNGLDPIIRAEVRCLSPNGLDEMISNALLVEEKYRVLNTIAPRTVPDPPSRTMSVSEYESIKERGLCFRCDEKFIVGRHQCRNRELRVFLVHDEEYEEVPNKDTKPTETALGRMTFRGEIKDSEVIVLIGSGSTHNFVSQRLIEKLQLPLIDTSNYSVVRETGATVERKGICEAVVLNFPGFTVIEDFIPLDLWEIDVILGVQWLKKLGRVDIDWRNLVMKFQKGDSTVTLKGDPTLVSKRMQPSYYSAAVYQTIYRKE